MSSNVVLFEPGDKLPQLMLCRAERVLPGDVYWGIQLQDNLRKGFLLETEGVLIKDGAIPAENGTVTLGSFTAVKKDHMVLIEQH